MADPYESVGPSVFTAGGVVGVLWLDGPAGADEFDLAARLAGGFGHSAFFGDVELVSEQPRVEPMFHSCFGLAGSDRIHAAWVDRRDYPTQGHNIYTSRQLVAPNLAPFTPDGWSDSLVGNILRTSRTTGYLAWSHLGMGEDLPLEVYRHWKAWCRYPHYLFDDPADAEQTLARIAGQAPLEQVGENARTVAGVDLHTRVREGHVSRGARRVGKTWLVRKQRPAPDPR